MNISKQIKTILIHKKYVFEVCCKLGIPLQGILHDISKLSPTELFESSKYYVGTESPIISARKNIGYSRCWNHHVRHNLHHWEAWLDIRSKDEIIPIPMPNKRIKEMIGDRIAACRTYNPETWDYSKPLEYLMKNKHKNIMHLETEIKLIHCLTLLSENGEDAFNEIKEYLK